MSSTARVRQLDGRSCPYLTLQFRRGPQRITYFILKAYKEVRHFQKLICYRRDFIDYHFTGAGLALSSMASPPNLGTPDHIHLQGREDLVEKLDNQRET